MDLTTWTLEYNGTELSFAGWGFTEPKMGPRKLAVTTFTVRIPGATNLVAGPPIPFNGQVIVRRYRTVAAGGGFSGGEIVFQGRQINDKRMATGNPADVLTFGNAWWDLENLPFQQQWKYADTDPISGEVTVTGLSQPFCQLNLFQGFTTGFGITNGAQMEEIINWAIGCGVALQVGTIDLAWYLQPYPASALSCASALRICLKPSPGACCWIDMSTTPPTFNCRERYYHEALSLPYASGNHRISELVPRYDMQVPQVVIQYRKTMQVTAGGSSSSWTVFPYDAWPLDATLDEGVRGGKQVGAMVVPIQLAGFSQTILEQTVTAVEFSTAGGLAWFKGKKPAMREYSDLVMVAGSLKILDAAGADVTGTILAIYPNEFVDGQVGGWMKNGAGDTIGVESVTVQAAFTYSEKDANGQTWHTVGWANPHVVSVNARLTNSAVGARSYAVTTALDSGQFPVSNLAQFTWTLLNWLFWDGTHSIVEQNAAGAPEVGAIIDCRYALNLTGGAAAWAGMLSPVHGADIDFTHGTTDIQIGLPEHVGPADLEQLLQFYKFRKVLNDAGLRTSGNNAGGGGSVGGATAKENTSDSKAPPSLHVTAAPVLVAYGGRQGLTRIGHDAEQQTISMLVAFSDGTPVPNVPQVLLALGDLAYST